VLAARMAADGYLYLPGLLPPRVVADVQREVAAIARDAGWLRPDVPRRRITASSITRRSSASSSGCSGRRSSRTRAS
jgi:hypothetical protein